MVDASLPDDAVAEVDSARGIGNFLRGVPERSIRLVQMTSPCH